MPTICVGDSVRFYNEEQFLEMLLLKKVMNSDIHRLLIDKTGKVESVKSSYVTVSFPQVKMNDKPVHIIFARNTFSQYPDLLVKS